MLNMMLLLDGVIDIQAIYLKWPVLIRDKGCFTRKGNVRLAFLFDGFVDARLIVTLSAKVAICDSPAGLCHIECTFNKALIVHN